MEPISPQIDPTNQPVKEPFRLLVESVVDYAIFMLDSQGNVQTWNRGAERIKGYTADEIIGRHFSCFYPRESIAIGWPQFELKEAAEKGRFEDEAWRLVVRLPLRAAGLETQDAMAAAEMVERRMAASRILVVDDDRGGADTTGKLLRIWGNDVRVCYDGKAALSVVASFQPHVALLDIGLPQLNGYEIAQHLRKLPALSDLVLIAVTGYGQEEDVRHIQQAGFDHYFIKPIDAVALMNTLTALRPYPNEKDSSATPPPMIAPPSTSLG